MGHIDPDHWDKLQQSVDEWVRCGARGNIEVAPTSVLALLDHISRLHLLLSMYDQPTNN